MKPVLEAAAPSVRSISTSDVARQQLVGRDVVELGQPHEARHRECPLAPLVGAEDRGLELLAGPRLDLVQRQALLAADRPKAVPDLRADRWSLSALPAGAAAPAPVPAPLPRRIRGGWPFRHAAWSVAAGALGRRARRHGHRRGLGPQHVGADGEASHPGRRRGRAISSGVQARPRGPRPRATPPPDRASRDSRPASPRRVAHHDAGPRRPGRRGPPARRPRAAGPAGTASPLRGPPGAAEPSPAGPDAVPAHDRPARPERDGSGRRPAR